MYQKIFRQMPKVKQGTNTIISKVLGKERLPMLIADQKINYDDKNKFNAKLQH